jgi:serine protease Do
MEQKRFEPGIRVLRGGAATFGAVAVASVLVGAGIGAAQARNRAAVGSAATPVAQVAASQPVPDGRPRADSYADLVAKAAPAVVTIRATRSVRQTGMQVPGENEFFRRFFGEDNLPTPRAPRREAGLGSGVVVSRDGYILTNHHVIEGSERVRVDFSDDRSYEARAVGSDAPSDLAVLKIEASNLATLPLADSDKARVGDVVLAIGNPLGIGQTVTMGIISGKGRAPRTTDNAFEDFIQTDAPINQGNSGGALVNTRGELVGINSQILSPVGFNIGIGFAIPSNMADDVMEQLIKTGSVKRGMLGVAVQGVTPELARSLGLSESRGALVSEVRSGTPADKAGIERGDVILAVNGATVDSSNSLRNRVARLAPGTNATVRLRRNGREQDVTVALAELPAERSNLGTGDRRGEESRYGLSVEPLTPELARRLEVESKSGVVVRDLDPNGKAAEAGLRTGDVIEQVNQKSVFTPDELKRALDATPKDRPALLLVTRGGSTIFMTIQAGN